VGLVNVAQEGTGKEGHSAWRNTVGGASVFNYVENKSAKGKAILQKASLLGGAPEEGKKWFISPKPRDFWPSGDKAGRV